MKIISVLLKISVIIIVIQFASGNTSKWCWTKNMANEVSFQLNSRDGGINWGYCSQGGNSKSEVEKEYAVQVDTSSVKGSGTT